MNLTGIVLSFNFLLLAFSAHSSLPPIKIHITVNGYTSGTARLIGFNGDQNYLADTAAIDVNGSMRFSKSEAFTAGLYYLTLPDAVNFQILIDGETAFSLKTAKSDPIGAMQVTGSLNNELMYRNMKFQRALEPKFSAVHNQLLKTSRGTPEYQELKIQENQILAERNEEIESYRKNYPDALFTKFKLGGQNPTVGEYLRPDGVMDTTLQVYVFRSHYWDDFDFKDARLLHTPVFFNKIKAYTQQLTAQNPDSIIASADALIDRSLVNKEMFQFAANWIALQYKPGQTPLMDGEAVYSHLILKYFTPKQAFWSDSLEIKALREQAQNMRQSLIGMKGKDVWGKDKNGALRSMYQLKAPAATILFIYNPDCEHCQDQTPVLRKVYDAWKSRGVEVFSIASQADEAKWRAFGPKYGVNWTDVRDPDYQSRYPEKYYIDNTPEIYVLDKDKIIVAKNLKADQLPDILTATLSAAK